MTWCVRSVSVRGTSAHRPAGQGSSSTAFVQVKRRAWDSNPRGRSRALAVFKTAAIGH
jgi:hypothetical protein